LFACFAVAATLFFLLLLLLLIPTLLVVGTSHSLDLVFLFVVVTLSHSFFYTLPPADTFLPFLFSHTPFSLDCPTTCTCSHSLYSPLHSFAHLTQLANCRFLQL
jgi:hypothetical protein